MSKQQYNWQQLSTLIAEKVQEYIDEADTWDGEVFIWTDGNEADVNLGVDGEDYPGEKEHVSDFIVKNDNGVLTPNYDKIDDYASGWFDMRLAD